MKFRFKKLKLFALAFSFAYLHAPSSELNAANIASSPCDPAYYQSLENRAWLEAQREVTQNQNLIFKPDSVLSYICFDKHLDTLGNEAINMFSESTRWGTILSDTSMNLALQQLVSVSLASYIDSNFHGGSPVNTRLLGGRNGMPTRPTISASVPNGSYSCSVMETVWKRAKCYDFMTETQDGFFTFEDYKLGAQDWRKWPDKCSEPTTSYDDAMKLAGLGADPVAELPWAYDVTLTYQEFSDVAECGTHPPIETGLTVYTKNGSPASYPEYICVQPGCHYVPTGAAAGNCVD